MPPEQAFIQFDQSIARLFSLDKTPGGAIRQVGQLLTITVPAGQTIQQALESVELRLPQAVVALVNGGVTDLSYILQPGDTARLLLQISGG